MKTNELILKTLTFGLGASLALAGSALAAPTDISSQPLALPAANVPPNVMLLLDDSGSMTQQYTPDYLGRYFGGNNPLCYDSKDGDGSIDNNPENCEAGDPPLMSPDINTQYYNPEIRYYPAVDYTGTSMGDMDSATTSAWTKVPTDGVSLATQNSFRKNTLDMNNAGQGTVATADLVNSYPDRVWCDSQSRSGSDYTDTNKCRVNKSTGAYTYPDTSKFYYGRNGNNKNGQGQPTSSVKYVFGAPYYYRLLTTEYCTDPELTTCKKYNSPTGAYIYPAPVRYCTKSDLSTCQAKYQGSYDYPKFIGAISSGSRKNAGTFVRTDIVSSTASYPKAPGRSDCAGATTCTYTEEMTNFANWYTYYRLRDTMAKTAIGRAFAAISDQYRVGFITINPGSPVQSDRYLKADAFATGAGNQKDIWFQKLYGTGSNGSTPLREALSRVGRYYAGKTSGINDGMDGSPIQYSCQPNYTLAMTDGYWNGARGEDLSGSSIGNYDNVDAGYSTRAIGAYDGGGNKSPDTLADVAMYYYKTDLRTDLDDNVPTTQNDPAPFQHMTTFTVGLGLAGRLTFDPDYQTQTSGDFFDIKQGVKNWPTPSADSETALDDLWHAAVNGHGQFFSAKDPVTLAQGISETLQQVSSRVGAGAAAATSNLQPVAGDNFAFTADYKTVEWTGDVTARTIDLNSGLVASRALWSAQALLDQRNGTDRHIYTYDPADTGAPGNGNKLKAFCWSGAASPLYPGCDGEDELNATELGYFDPALLMQASGWTAGQTANASAQKFVDYLRGDSTNENTGASLDTDLFRKRTHKLGDIVDAQPAYVKGAPFGYDIGAYVGVDPHYQAFKQSTDGTTGTRLGTVYVAANDGMLHAFETDPDNNPYYQTAGIATTTTTDDAFTGTLSTNPVSGEGSERWAYIPGMVLAKLKNLGNDVYVHQYTVDGSPVIGDVCFGHTLSTPCSSQANWHTILVAGLNAGGRGYYALDVTDPQYPKALWELKGGSGTTCLTSAQANSGTFSEDCNIGLTFGNPIITKRKSDGKWVVMVTSGYNNLIPGDGQGHLYILDAQTGVILNRIDTGVGTLATPSGLGRINAWVDNAYNDNTALRVYGGDLQGNLWRFQLDNTEAGYLTAYKLTTLVDSTGTPQPITARPELGEVQGFAVVYVGTGKLLGVSDMNLTPPVQQQTIYAIRDDLTSGSISRSNMIQQSLSTIDAATRTSTGNAVDFNINKGWYIDLPDTGERVNVDPILQLGTLVVPTNVPSADSCVAGGYGWINFLDYRTGSYVPGASANMASTKIAASLVVGINVVQLPGGKVVTIVTTADNQQLTQETPVAPPTVSGRRVTWRELITE
jgi:type IV pilus assembly protein PilY1